MTVLQKMWIDLTLHLNTSRFPLTSYSFIETALEWLVGVEAAPTACLRVEPGTVLEGR